jgi:hypothetical protein
MPKTSTDTVVDLGARLATIEERLAELEDQERAHAAELAEDAIERLIGRVMPPDARAHLRAARKEQLLAARAFIDHWIERLDRPPAARRSRRPSRAPRRRESIPLE